ncbi:S-layer homology domain-containing protein [Lysinibacillus fusiformis]|uniref:Ig-like domain-containing protein n=1 Tax=Lysinibacillus fusiformis TaxID=28031 RepID=A0A1H9LWZ1_9BACI|nr:S-layer homology domain-containing protein [Lysinibacillus fusiformis]MCG7433800.1 S-layer homology domain-containing protein [Lysinibacillus fusiformis]SCY57583.1 Ig-like domain-containing protein [Lysinibacillus fusiformis]SEO28145.1 Ig-like domain-containing protein [Lysinibacillus fusiformis]SER15363.1 Ig-like domain-containing protein [Lysinibacillus fusiformis]
MAKQNKGRKFFAASATAALVASAIVPVASAAQLNDFNKISGYAKEAVQSLVDAGVIQGDANGNFNPLKTISRAEAATIFTNALELEAEGDVNFKDVKADAWYYDAIAATVENGIFEGVSATEFAPNKQLTRSEAAKILVDAFELEGEGDLSEFADASTVKPWAKSYLEIAVANGVIKGSEANGKTNLNPNAPITRQDFAVVFSRTIENVDATPKVDKIEVVDAKTLNVTLSDGTKETVTLEKALEPNKETEVTFKIKDVEYKAKVTYVVTTATAVKSVSATNLKQVVVEFDGKVDPSTASEKDNYTLSGAKNPVVDSVIVAEDGKSVTLNVVDHLENQSEYKLALNNIKAGDKVLNVKDLKFKPLDNTVPTVAKVEALGNKTIRVQFSEPVKPAQTSQFQIDGKTVVGSIQTNLNTVIIKLSSTLTDGEHTLTAEGTQDYNNFKTVKADTKFNVVEDKTAPTVTSVVSASFEKVVLKFSEPVEQVFASNVYWMQGGAKKTASTVKQLTDDTFEFTFNSDNKLVYTTDLYVTNVKDYSGNVIDKDTKVQVTPVIDQTRPEVISSTFVKDKDNKEILIKFTKTLDSETAGKAANYVIKDKDGKVQPISSTVNVKDKEVTIKLLNSLKDNTDYTLAINGVSDNTTLKNVMLPYTTTLSVKDVTPPTVEKVTRLNSTQLYVQFSEAMSTSGDGSVVDSSKYTIKNLETNKTLTPASFNVTSDSKGVIITFNEGLSQVVGKNEVTIQLVKDLADNYLKDLKATKTDIVAAKTAVTTVTAVDKKKIEVEFDTAIQSLNAGDFKFGDYKVDYSELSANGKKATFTLQTELNEDVKVNNAPVQLTINNAQSVDILGEKIADITVGKNVADEIKATVKGEPVAVGTTGTQIKFTFNEAVIATPEAKSDFIVKDAQDKTVEVSSVSSTGNEVTVTLATPVAVATISTAKDVRYIKDIAGNTIVNIEPKTVELPIVADTTAPTLTAVGVTTPTATGGVLEFTSNEAGAYSYLVLAAADTAPTVDEVIAQGTAVAKGTGAATAAANTVTLTGLTTATNYKAYVVVVDAAGNKSLVSNATFTTL